MLLVALLVFGAIALRSTQQNVRVTGVHRDQTNSVIDPNVWLKLSN